ncbi:hypothetical protein AB0F81_43980 [Actinoplanes sp. NPDC024001]|uniref:hypothetical protein n=1 Tax=Actinoplanes sp. NPDC024001 TaxID=3154598 RepID=UPI0034014CFE
MIGDLSFWLGLALAIPVGLGVNLMTPAAARQLSQYSARARRRVAQATEDEAELVDWLAQNREAFIFFEVRFREGEVVRTLTVVFAFVAGVLMTSVAGEVALGYSLLLIGMITVLLIKRANSRYHRIRRPVMRRLGWPNEVYASPRAAAHDLRQLRDASERVADKQRRADGQS